jgi:hypothetical protein
MHIREPHTTKLKMMRKRRLKECSKRLHVGGCYWKRVNRDRGVHVAVKDHTMVKQ